MNGNCDGQLQEKAVAGSREIMLSSCKLKSASRFHWIYRPLSSCDMASIGLGQAVALAMDLQEPATG